MVELKSVAQYEFEDLVASIKDFQNDLIDAQEMGIVASSAGDILHITRVGNDGGQIVVFNGIDGQGRPSRLIQDYSQINLQLVAVDKLAEQARRIGF